MQTEPRGMINCILLFHLCIFNFRNMCVYMLILCMHSQWAEQAALATANDKAPPAKTIPLNHARSVVIRNQT